MGTFQRAFIGAWAGKIAAALFIAVCAALGFGPEKWATYVLSGLVEPLAARIGFIALGGAAVFCLIRFSSSDARATAAEPDVRHLRLPERPAGSISLRDAARGAYEQIRGSDFAKEVEEIGRTPLEILRLMAQQFLGRGVVIGKRWPADTYELLDGNKRKGWNILDDINSLAYLYQREPIIRDCVVKTSDIEDFVKYARTMRGRI